MKNSYLPLFIIFSILVSILIGIRSYDIGRDTELYVNHFSKSRFDDNFLNGFELGFEFLMFTIAKLGGSVEFFFFVVAFIVTLVYLLFFNKITYNSKKNKRVNLYDFSIFFTLLLMSNWYLTLTTNGIRQGISIAILYLALYFLVFLKNKWKFLIFYILATSFHYSSLVLFPFLILLRLKTRYIFFLWVIFGFFYVIGLNEQLILLTSNKLNLPLYEFIKLYSLEKNQLPGTGLYEGFNSLFFIYTIFWPILLFLIIKVFNSKYFNHQKESIMKILSCYLILCLPYFIFGFGPFSNRYAFFSWFFVPIIQYFSITAISIDKLSIKLSSSLFLFALLYFSLFQLEWISLF